MVIFFFNFFDAGHFWDISPNFADLHFKLYKKIYTTKKICKYSIK